jgi:hypothetical protein
MKNQIRMTIKAFAGAAVCAIVLLAAGCTGSGGDRSRNGKLSDSALAVRDHLDSLKKKWYRNNDISIIFLEATSEIMQAQIKLERADIQGIKNGADSFIVNTPKGDSLYYAIKHMYEIGAVYAQDEDQRALFEEQLLPAEPKPWLIKQFGGKPIDKSLSKLKEFDSDCKVINKIVRR